jgi:hypothetical protein
MSKVNKTSANPDPTTTLSREDWITRLMLERSVGDKPLPSGSIVFSTSNNTSDGACRDTDDSGRSE